MTRKFKPRLEILPTAQRRLWPKLGNTPNLGFTLYGGTAIALRLGHRDSVDFDFFSERPLNRDTIKARLPFMEQSTTLQDEDNTWVVLVPSASSSESLKALVYFNDGDLNTLTADEKGTLVNAVRVVRDLPDVALRSKSLGAGVFTD